MEINIKYGNTENLLLELFDSKNTEIDLSSYDFESITLKGKKYGETKQDDFDLVKTGSIYTDTNGDVWVRFSFTSSDYETLEVGKYICEIILEKESGVYYNLVDKKNNNSEHRFTLNIYETYVVV
jgi:hypothetical protein